MNVCYVLPRRGAVGMWANFWTWLATLPTGSASFLGTVAGSSLGLVAILIGALFNARLNRKRDDNLRIIETRSVAAALRAELAIIQKALDGNASRVDSTPPDKDGGFLAPDLAHLIQVMPLLLPKIGLLQPDSIQTIIGAYGLIQQYCESLIMLGGRLQEGSMPDHRRLVYMPAKQSQSFATISKNISTRIGEAIATIDTYLK